MTHDQMCPHEDISIYDPCRCDLIAMVREDEKANQALAKAVSGGDNYFRGYAAALRDGIAAIEEQQRLWKEDTLTRIGLGIAKAAIGALGGER